MFPWWKCIRTDALGRQDNVTVSAHMIYQIVQLSDRRYAESIYRIPLQAPAAMARDIKSNAAKLEAVLLDVEVKHPLVR